MNEPFLRPAAPEGAAPAACPPGHEAEPAGLWQGRAMEVVYDPRRHDVAFLRGSVSTQVLHGLASTGWEHRLSDGPNQMWTRDRTAVARRRLEQVSVAPAAARIA
jgi:hypothetical protein